MRDWLAFGFAALAAIAALSVRRMLVGAFRLRFSAGAEAVGQKTLRVTIRIHNGTLDPIEISKVEARNPADAILAMEGVHPPGTGPIRCRLAVPPMERGLLVFLMGRSEIARGRVSLRLTHGRPGRRWGRRRISLEVDPGLMLLPIAPPPPVTASENAALSEDPAEKTAPPDMEFAEPSTDR